MLTYNLDIDSHSRWLRTTPGVTALTQPYHCTEAGIFYAGKHFSTARTNKDSYLLFYTLQGAGLIEQGDTQITLKAGHALLLNCRTPQSYCTDSTHGCWHHYWAHINGAGVDAAASIINPQRITALPLPELTAREGFEGLLGLVEDSSTLSVVRQSLFIHLLLTGISCQALDRSEVASNRALVQQAAKYIQDHLADDISLDLLAATSHISKSYFLRLFRQHMGTTPYKYLLCCRITRAKELLVMTDLPIGEIGRRAGFGNDANFSTRFLQMTGQSPARYRNSLRQKGLFNDHA